MKLMLLVLWMLGLTCNCMVKGQQAGVVKKSNDEKQKSHMVKLPVAYALK